MPEFYSPELITASCPQLQGAHLGTPTNSNLKYRSPPGPHVSLWACNVLPGVSTGRRLGAQDGDLDETRKGKTQKLICYTLRFEERHHQ